MKLSTTVEIKPSEEQITREDKVTLMGSCFADHIGSIMSSHYFDVLANPLGILYDPISISRSLARSLQQLVVDPHEVQQSGDRSFHYHFHSRYNAASRDQVAAAISKDLLTTGDHLSCSRWLVLTLGTAYIHELVEGGGLVANCHKMPADRFSKRMLSMEEMHEAWSSLISRLSQLLPELRIIITVSPVRHTRIGMVRNSRSKARLIGLAHRLVEEYGHITYFPAYEIMMDELRDYRFYQEDMIHPSNTAVQLIWQRFVGTYFADDAVQMYTEARKIVALRGHRLLDDTEANRRELDQKLRAMEEQLLRQFPNARSRISPLS